MKILFTIISISCTSIFCSAQIYKSIEKGLNVSFFSETPLENIEANSNIGSSLINNSNDSIAFRIPILSFQFKQALMQNHFNENYIESEKYPYATFKGKINTDIDYLKNGIHTVTCTGKLNMHGVEQLQTINGTITVKGNEVKLESEFFIKPSDFKIEIPKVVFEKIAENIKIIVKAEYAPYNKK